MTHRPGPALTAAALISGAFVVMAVIPGLFVVPSPGDNNPSHCRIRTADGHFHDLLSPSHAHWFGTDQQGCDLYARVIHGAHVSVIIGLGAVLLATSLGLVIGGVAGSAGGRLDALLSRIIDTALGVPQVVIAILILSTRTHRTLGLLVAVIGLLGAPAAARIVRASVIEVRARSYIEAAHASGTPPLRVLWRHIGPNALPPVLLFTFVSIGPAIGVETTIAFLGLSIEPPAAGWGVLVAEGRQRLFDRPFLLLFPMAFLVAATLAFVTLGEQIQRHLDPKTRTRL